ncbi:molybdopterin-guanine dinucleotide biosynthesis protein B [Paenibacillus marchantiophytorum]|uniref:Molybdopterin-guanine dinucleotide biosynthesis protein B n=1 Tax=Paenibacillus marchantiophytorum TaxID=1619310 RepID=A0ABQ2BQS3_9BACL|nr:molybdopterin-guanine dinucleotide biosynthesis protein B [Paenibacillus marchantiophytorum]GGI45415.1 molybdopterin-guanine dinucleotide biosynthesis protein B [Paenibacillus marchantiophytorum]
MAHCIGFAGYSNSGKTTLIAKLVVEMKQRGYRIAVMKHDAHGHYKEAAGADSSIYVGSGADAVITLSPNMIHTYEKRGNVSLEEQLTAYSHMDFIFVEGFKKEKHPKIALFRTIEQREIVHHLEPSPIAIVTDLEDAESYYPHIPSMNLNEVARIADFIEHYFGGNLF